mgnify:CR=1 FL=1
MWLLITITFQSYVNMDWSLEYYVAKPLLEFLISSKAFFTEKSRQMLNKVEI